MTMGDARSPRLGRWLAAAWALLAPAAAWAQQLSPPTALDMPAIDAGDLRDQVTSPIEVEVILTIDEAGAVVAADVVRSGGPAFDELVAAGVRRFRFRPATQDGAPVAVRVPFVQRFVPAAAPPSAPAAVAAAADSAAAVIEGTVVTRGARTPVAGATVTAIHGGAGPPASARTDAAGAFVLRVRPERTLEIRIAAPDHEPFLQRERLLADQRLRVRYLVDRTSASGYEATVRAEADRTEVSRTSLSGRELTHVPGTFGDPFRVISLLPGVSTATGFLPVPVVRGNSPGTTGVLLDGVRLPMLFHLFAGPSIIHPELIERVDFYPGGFPVDYGGFIGGIVDGVTRPGRADERRLDLDLNLTQVGGFLRQPIRPLGVTASVAGRYGYPGLLLGLLTPDAALSYWDYQARVDGGSARHRWSVFVLGASDELKTRPSADVALHTALRFAFHRIDLRYQHGDATSREVFRCVLGHDDSLIADPDEEVVSGGLGAAGWSANPQLRLYRAPAPWLALELGAESAIRTVRNPPPPTTLDGDGQREADAIFSADGWFAASGVFAAAVWKPLSRLRVMPGVRADLYNERHGGHGISQRGLDPRLLARLRLGGEGAAPVWLKAVVGRYHQPPRVYVPVPGVDASSLELGLLASTQAAVGLEAPLGAGAELDLNVYANWMDPVLFELPVNDSVLEPQPVVPPWQLPPASAAAGLGDLATRRRGRGYGLELLLRRRDSERLFGWVSYTLSRAERRTGARWEPFDFDRRHMLNVVAGVRLPRNWEVGGRALYQSGTPLATVFGYNAGRSGPQFRFDLRVDKRAVWNRWLLDFYIDVVNATAAEESGGLLGSQPVRYVIPTIGLRAVL
jgi:TonB family protein